MQDCPCNNCTAETGRGPDCHRKDCPRGWYEWDQLHKTEHEAARARKKQRQAADGVLIASRAKRRREKNQ